MNKTVKLDSHKGDGVISNKSLDQRATLECNADSAFRRRPCESDRVPPQRREQPTFGGCNSGRVGSSNAHQKACLADVSLPSLSACGPEIVGWADCPLLSIKSFPSRN